VRPITPTLAICILAVVAGIVAAVADLGADAGTTPPAASGYGDEPSATITIELFEFSDSPVSPGATVTVDNADNVPHTLTADDRAFDTGVIDGEASGTFVAPDAPGTYAIHCDVHPGMKSNLVVAP
jgi:plastocyanin